MTGELGRGFGGLIEQATSPVGLAVIAGVVILTAFLWAVTRRK